MELKKKALQLVARRSFHSEELRVKLRDLGSSDEVNLLLLEFKRLSLLDDERWEELFLLQMERGCKSTAYLKSKLYQKGFSRSEIARLAEVYSVQENVVLERLIEKECGLQDRLRLIRRLQAKGFSFDQIQRTLQSKPA